MALLGNITSFAHAVPAARTLLAIDASQRAFGLAGSDAGKKLATPLHTIRRSTRLDADLAKLRQVIEAREVGGLVLGYPISMDGTEGPRCQEIRTLAGRLEAAFDLPVLLFDERLSTFAAEDALEALGRRPKPGEALDHYAAATFLGDLLACWPG
ncbi:MAG: Holliday junction resolvase RuvX [Geminicoccaceae bacterium]